MNTPGSRLFLSVGRALHDGPPEQDHPDWLVPSSFQWRPAEFGRLAGLSFTMVRGPECDRIRQLVSSRITLQHVPFDVIEAVGPTTHYGLWNVRVFLVSSTLMAETFKLEYNFKSFHLGEPPATEPISTDSPESA